MNRIVIIGATGTGKSTLAEKIATKQNITHIDLDDLFWLPGWTERAPEDFRARVEAATKNGGWVTAGNYRIARDILWPRADTIVWLDYPFHTTFARLLRRSLGRIFDKRVICNGNTESLRKFLSQDSIMVWLFKSFPKHHREYGEMFDNQAAHPHITFLRFRTPAEADLWLKDLA